MFTLVNFRQCPGIMLEHMFYYTRSCRVCQVRFLAVVLCYHSSIGII